MRSSSAKLKVSGDHARGGHTVSSSFFRRRQLFAAIQSNVLFHLALHGGIGSKGTRIRSKHVQSAVAWVRFCPSEKVERIRSLVNSMRGDLREMNPVLAL